MPTLVLASGSPRRRGLLAMLGVDFQVVPPTVDEQGVGGETPEAATELAALAKAQAVAGQCSDTVIVGADTIVLLDSGQTLGKPRGAEEAEAMLSALAGRCHRVVTGVAIFYPPTAETALFHVTTKVYFRRLSPGEIARYVATGEPLDKAGAYGIQGKGSLFVERIEGCYFNVVGLPLSELAMALQRFGIELL